HIDARRCDRSSVTCSRTDKHVGEPIATQEGPGEFTGSQITPSAYGRHRNGAGVHGKPREPCSTPAETQHAHRRKPFGRARIGGLFQELLADTGELGKIATT